MRANPLKVMLLILESRQQKKAKLSIDLDEERKTTHHYVVLPLFRAHPLDHRIWTVGRDFLKPKNLRTSK
jgi:hypothetical protein